MQKNTLPGMYHAKDLNLSYLYMSQEVVNLVGWKDTEDAIGKTDHDLKCDAVRYAENFRQMDRKTIHAKAKLVTLEIATYTTGVMSLIGERSPILNDEGICLGLSGVCINITETAIFKNYLQIHQIDKKRFSAENNYATYILSNVYKPLDLTEKQENCLFLLIRGKTIKQIAQILGVSPRTVEDHLDAIKVKLRCHTRAQIIEHAINAGFVFYIPLKFQK